MTKNPNISTIQRSVLYDNLVPKIFSWNALALESRVKYYDIQLHTYCMFTSINKVNNFRLIITIIPIPIKSVWELFQLICNCFKSDMPIKHRNCGINSNSTTNQLIRKILLCINYVLLFVIIEPRLRAKKAQHGQKESK